MNIYILLFLFTDVSFVAKWKVKYVILASLHQFETAVDMDRLSDVTGI